MERSKPNRAAEIRATLEGEIESGHLPPGSGLDERMLAERFGVSRTPVREALQQLAAQEMVRIVPRQGVVVSGLSINELRQRLELLGELEAVCARLAARRMKEDERIALAAAHQRGEQAHATGDLAAYTRENTAFHGLIHLGSHNPHLASEVGKIYRQVRRYLQHDLLTAVRADHSAADHKLICDAILAGDEEKAERAMLAHVMIGSSGFAEFISTLPAHLFTAPAGQRPGDRSMAVPLTELQA